MTKPTTLEEENIKLRFDLQRAKADANKQYRRAAQFEELLTQARQEIEFLQASASRALMDFQQANARRNGAGRS